jgi:tetratricopeptide (TPR) repeat protein
VVLTPEERINIDKKPTENIDAYNHYLIGNYLFYQLTPDSFRKAIDQYKKAIELDSEFAEAYCNLAFTYINLMGWFATPSTDYIPKVKSNLLKALEIDNKLGEAYYMLGAMNFLYEWDWDEADKNFRKGLDLNPNFIMGMIEYANFLSSMRRFDESFRISRRTIELDPLNPVAYNELAFSLWLTGETEQALEVLDESLELDTGHRQTLWGSMTLNTELGNFNKALSFLEKLKGNSEIIEIPAYLLGQAGKLMVYLGRREEAITYLNELNRRADEEGYKDTYPQAVIFIALGEHEKALELLEQAFMNRDFAMAQMNIQKDLDPLRSYDRFQNIMKKMDFQ